MKRFLIIAAVLSVVAAGSASAQMMGSGEGGYGGYGGRMGQGGGGPGGYDGMMGSDYGWRGERQLTLREAEQLLDHGAAAGHVDRARKEVVFTGTRVLVAMAAVQPGFADTTFEVDGLVDPTIVVPSGSFITLDLVNMDYGPNMDHGVVITKNRPPYPVLGMMGMPGAFAGVAVLAPRDRSNVDEARYPEASISFRAPATGVYYYLCQYYDHAAKGMYGKFIVAGN